MPLGLASPAAMPYRPHMVDSASADVAPTPLSDLLAASAAGDRRAFETLYRQTSAKLFAICRRLLVRDDLAEEVLQEAYVRIWHRAADYRADRGTPMTWMITVVRNGAVDRLRQLRRDPESETIDPELMDFAAPASDVDRRDTARALSKCLQTLDDGPRRAIVMAYCLGYSHDELAVRLSVPLGTAKSWIRRGLLRLRDCFGA